MFRFVPQTELESIHPAQNSLDFFKATGEGIIKKEAKEEKLRTPNGFLFSSTKDDATQTAYLLGNGN